MEEIWKDIEGYEGLYQVSSFGRVRSLDRFSINSLGYKRLLKGNLRKTVPDKDGYLLVGLSGNGKKPIAGKVHRLVALAFIPNPEKKSTVNHKNGIKTDNRVVNLEWATRSENTRHAFSNKLINTEKQVVQLSTNGILIEEFESMAKACESTGANISTVCMVCNNKRGRITSNGFKWMYKTDYDDIKNNR